MLSETHDQILFLTVLCVPNLLSAAAFAASRKHRQGHAVALYAYRGTSLIRNRPPPPGLS